MPTRKLILPILLIAFLSFACVFSPAPIATPDAGLIATLVAQTLTAQAGPAAENVTDTAQAPIETAPLPAAPHLPTHPGSESIPLPTGLAACHHRLN